MSCGVYLIRNTENEKIYIGYSKDVERRLRQHSNVLKRGKHHNSHLQAAWFLYGADTFQFLIIEKCDISIVAQREAYWIQFYDACNHEVGYNQRLEDGTRHFVVSDITKQKQSKAMKGRIRSQEHCKNLSESNRGKILSEETKRKISEKCKNLPLTGAQIGPKSEETKQKISQTLKGISFTNEQKEKGRLTRLTNKILKQMNQSMIEKSFNAPEIHTKNWGRELWIHNDTRYCGKLLQFDAGKRCSLHYHKLKHETFYLESGILLCRFFHLDEMQAPGFDIEQMPRVVMSPGDVKEIPPLLVHQMIAVSGPARLFEFSTEHFDTDSYRIAKGD